MAKRVNPEMIVLARETMGFTQSDLAHELQSTQATVSRYEAGAVDVPSDHLQNLARVLRRPVSFFFWEEGLYAASCLYHRKRKQMSVKELKKVHAQVNVLRIQATRLLHYTEIQSAYTFHRIDMQKGRGPAVAARKLRYLWQLPIGPVRSVVGAVERAGGIVFHCPFDTVHVDGISQWPLDAPELPPVFFVNSKLPGDRQRLTLAHEIGHITLHHFPTDDPECEASEFAGEFLMPADEIKDELAELTLPKAAALKSRWKVSIQSLVFRAWQLGAITESRYSYLFKELSRKGYRKCEPVPLPAEAPNMLREIIRVHKSSSGQTTTDLSSFLGMLEEDFREAYWHDLSGVRLVG